VFAAFYQPSGSRVSGFSKSAPKSRIARGTFADLRDSRGTPVWLVFPGCGIFRASSARLRNFRSFSLFLPRSRKCLQMDPICCKLCKHQVFLCFSADLFALLLTGLL